MRWCLAAAAGLLCFAAVIGGTFVPLRDASGLQYLYAWPGGAALGRMAVACTLGVVAVWLVMIGAARRAGGAAVAEARAGRWLAPLAALAVVVVGVAPAVPGVGERGAVLGYFFYDLRWWWAVTLGAVVAWRADRLLGSPVARSIAGSATWFGRRHVFAIDAALCVGVMAWAVVTTPHLRFSGALHGDEVKYVRYCENWYQGRGFDIVGKPRMTELPPNTPSAVLKNLALLPGAVREGLSDLVNDLQGFSSDPFGFRWNRAISDEAGFVQDKRRTRVYQLYLPGLSAVLLPGYYLDRRFLGVTPGYQEEFPAELVMTNLTMLLVYGASAVALFRLLRRALDSELLAAAAAATAVISLPIGAFAFQLYTEVPALLLIVLLAHFAWFRAPSATTRLALMAGLAAGALLWLHARFLLIAVLLVAVGARRTISPARRWLIAAFVTMLFGLCAFNYHVTGSWSPTALWDANVSTHTFALSSVANNLVGYAIHGTLGVIPHAPWVLAVLPGLIVIARQQRGLALFLVSLALALGVPAAGHVLTPSGGTPGRLVAAVVPLMIWPAALLARHLWQSPSARVVTAILVILSLEAATTYNLSHRKAYGGFVDDGISGWRPNLAFPEARRYLEALTQPGFLVFLAVLALGGWWLWRILRRAATSLPESRRPASRGGVVAGVVAILVATCTVLTAAFGRWTRGDYLLHERLAHQAGVAALVEHDRCRVCFTSRHRQVDWAWLAAPVAADPQVSTAIDGRLLWLEVKVESPAEPAAGRVVVDFGDGTHAAMGLVGRREITHDYDALGEYIVVTSVHLRDRRWADRRVIAVKEK